jgi:hypothetical protein
MPGWPLARAGSGRGAVRTTEKSEAGDEQAKRSAQWARDSVRDRLVAALLEVPSLSDRQARALLVELVGEAVGRAVSLRDQPTARLELLQLVRFCAAIEDGISQLARSVVSVEAGSVQVDAVLRLADEWNALHAVPELLPSWALLKRALAVPTVPSSLRVTALQEATDRQLSEPPVHSDTPWSDLLYLCGRNAAAGRIPPWMLYLERATVWMDASDAQELRARSRKVALKWSIAGDLDQQRWVLPALRPFEADRHPEYQEYLAIQIAPEPLVSERYTVSHLFLSDARGRGWEPGDARRGVARHELEQAVSAVVSHVEQTNGDRAAHLRLEFVLPFELINLPVDWWPRDTSEVPGVPLALDYPVVVRSLDRLVHSDWHRRWRNRWNQLMLDEPASRSVFMSTDQHHGPTAVLEARLSDERCVALVLSEPPAADRSQGHREVRAALHSGLPVVIWHRKESSTQEFRHALESLLAGGLQQFPERLVELRRQAAACNPEGQEQHLGRHLTVLWDDPDRKPIPAPHHRSAAL